MISFYPAFNFHQLYAPYSILFNYLILYVIFAFILHLYDLVPFSDLF